MPSIKTFKIKKGGVISQGLRKDEHGNMTTFQIHAEQDMLGISGKCEICKQFPCKHTHTAVTQEFQTKEYKKVVEVTQ